MSRVAIVGCGAMGSVYAALMVSAGHEIFAITSWPDHAEAMAKNGLRVEGFSGDRTVKVHASTHTDGIGPVDLVIIATKAMDVEDAARASLQLLGPDTPVQTIQNGLGSAEKVAAIVGADRTVVGVVGGFGASVRAPGHIHHNGMEIIHFGAYGGLPRPALEASAEIWRSAGFNVELYDNCEQMQWQKLLVNVTFSATCALTGLTLGQVLDDPQAWPIARGCLLEAVAVAGAKGIDLGLGDPVAHVMKIGRKIAHARPSMLLDHLDGRRAEINEINGSIPREGAKVNVPTPINATLVGLLKARESQFA